MSHVRIAGESFAIERAALEVRLRGSEEAGWNLEIVSEGASLWLSGTVRPRPGAIDALDGAEASIDLRSLDEVVGALLGRAVTLYPNGQGVCALTIPLARTARGARLAVECACGWDRALETFDAPGPVALSLDIEAEVAAPRPDPVP